MEDAAAIHRTPQELTNERYDVVVVGGGIYGACVLLEASRRGLKALLIERDDFGGATSWNSLRIIHGGLRYLQTADLSRFQRSVAEQAWWLKHFPDIVEPMSCSMPLYDRGIKRRSIMRWALQLNDVLANRVRRKFDEHNSYGLPASKVISAAETIERFPQVQREGLKAAGMWFDARMNSPQRLMMEVLRWASFAGGKALNYMTCTGLLENSKRGKAESQGVAARCGLTSDEFEFQADFVVNCAGPWVAEISSNCYGPDTYEVSPPLNDDYAIAYNIVVDRQPISSDAQAISPRGGKNTYFFVPIQQRMMIGTAHLPPGDDETIRAHLSTFLNEINNAIPGFRVSKKDIVAVLRGRIPARSVGSHLPRKSPKIRISKDPTNLITIEGVKYTTARHLAEKTLQHIAEVQGRSLAYVQSHRPAAIINPNTKLEDIAVHDLLSLVRNESVMHLDDLLLRRTDNLVHATELVRLGETLASRVDWNETRQKEELVRLKDIGLEVSDTQHG